MTQQQAVAGLRDYAKTKYGKDLSDQDFANYAQKSGYTGGDVDENQYNAARGAIDTAFAPTSGGTGGPPPPAAGPPTPLPAGYQAPVFTQQQNPLWGQMQGILRNPHTMNQQWQDQAFEQQKELGNSMRQQLGQQVQQSAVSRGVGAGSGATQAVLGGLDQNLVEQLLGARRNISQTAAIQNRADEMGALQLAEALQSGQFGRDLSAYGANLQGAQQQFAGGMGMYGLQEAARTGDRAFNLQDWLARMTTQLEQNKFTEGQRQFNQGFGLDFLRYLQQGNQFDRSLNQNQGQFNNNMALNWFNANNNQNNNFLNFLLGSGLFGR